ncbi:MAG: MBL fold metallo-hydrolase [Paracoccaceae bacterium]
MMNLRFVSIVLLSFLAAPAAAVESHCIALSQAAPKVFYTGTETTKLAADEVRISYIGHSTYLVETAGGIRSATDFTGFVGPDVVPDIVTMNRAHTSHFTETPDPRIPHVLLGWGQDGKPAEHFLDLGELLVRNVTTDIRSRFGGPPEKDANSIFIFEVAGLCIGHLGHLHHEPSEAQYARIGRLDVVMAPVDGGMTLDLPTMIKVLKRLRASLVLPMHWFGDGTLAVFLRGMQDEFVIERVGGKSIVVSLRNLPRRPTIRVLRQGFVGLDDLQ